MAETVRSDMVEFPANGAPMPGFLARPAGEGSFPGVIVVQEWWGLEDHIKDVAQRFAREGFAALAPDLYRGKVTPEPDEAQKLMMALDMNRAARELARGADYLASQPFTAGRAIGSIGFCMGGGLALTLACGSPHVRAAAPFYGANPNPVDRVRDLRGPVFSVYAENDGWINARVREELAGAMQRYGKQFESEVYPGAAHGFFNDTKPGQYNPAAAQDAWQRVLTLFRDNL